MTLVLPDWLVVAADRPPNRGWGLRVDGDRVDRVGPHAELRQAFPDDEVIEAPDRALLPGFVNAHVHLYGTLAHGIPVDEAPADFWGFLDDYWWPKVEDALDTEMIVAATDFACAEMLRSGITTFYDIVEAPNALPEVLLAQREVVRRHGQRGLLSFEATERSGQEIARRGLAENADFIDACRDDDDAPDPYAQEEEPAAKGKGRASGTKRARGAAATKTGTAAAKKAPAAKRTRGK